MKKCCWLWYVLIWLLLRVQCVICTDTQIEQTSKQTNGCFTQIVMINMQSGVRKHLLLVGTWVQWEGLQSHIQFESCDWPSASAMRGRCGGLRGAGSLDMETQVLCMVKLPGSLSLDPFNFCSRNKELDLVRPPLVWLVFGWPTRPVRQVPAAKWGKDPLDDPVILCSRMRSVSRSLSVGARAMAWLLRERPSC